MVLIIPIARIIVYVTIKSHINPSWPTQLQITIELPLVSTSSTKNIFLNKLHLVSDIFTLNKGYMTLAIRFSSPHRVRHATIKIIYLTKVITIIMIIIIPMYSLSDLGFSSNLTGFLSKKHNSLSKESIMCDPNKTNWPA